MTNVVETRFDVGDTVYWISQVVDNCGECGHFLNTTTPEIMEGEVTGILWHKKKNTAICHHEDETPPPATINQIEYDVHNPAWGTVIYTENFFLSTREEAERLLNSQVSEDQADGFRD